MNLFGSISLCSSRDRAVELELLAPRPDGETPPVQCSSRNSLANLTTRVDSIEFISLNTRDNNSFGTYSCKIPKKESYGGKLKHALHRLL